MLGVAWWWTISFAGLGGDACGACELGHLGFCGALNLECRLAFLGWVAEAVMFHEPLVATSREISARVLSVGWDYRIRVSG